jgi:hypothetical protein
MVSALIVPNADVNLSSVQKWHLIETKSLDQFHVHIGESFSVTRQKGRQDAFDSMRRRCNPKHAAISLPEQRGPFAERVNMAQCITRIRQELLAFGGEDEPTPDPIKQPDTKFSLQIADLP